MNAGEAATIRAIRVIQTYYTVDVFDRPDGNELRKKIIEAKNDFIHSKTSSKVFLDKTHEFEELILEEKSYRDKYYRKKAEGGDEFSCDFAISGSTQRIEYYRKELRRFTFLHDVSLGKKKEKFNVEEIKNAPIESLLGKPINRSGKELMYKCPLHNDKSPSFSWSKKKQLWHCFGCGEGGDIIALYQKLNNCDFKTACDELKRLV